MSELLTVEDLQKRWGCSVRTIERYRKEGLIAVKVGGVKFRPADVEDFEESRLTAVPKKRRARRDAPLELKHV